MKFHVYKSLPRYLYEALNFQTPEFALGTYWKNGFLICGGISDPVAQIASKQCSHVPVGGINPMPFAGMQLARIHPAAVRVLSGSWWVTGGGRSDSFNGKTV